MRLVLVRVEVERGRRLFNHCRLFEPCPLLSPPSFSLCLSRSLILYIYLAPAYSPFHSVSSLAVLSLSFSFRLFIYLAFGILLSFVPRARSSPVSRRQRSAIYILHVKILFTARANHRPVPASSFASQAAFPVFLIGPTYLSTNFAPHKTVFLTYVSRRFKGNLPLETDHPIELNPLAVSYEIA